MLQVLFGAASIFKISHVKNVNKSKNCLVPIKLESKKQDKKMLASREGSLHRTIGRRVPLMVQQKFSFD